MRVLGTAPMVWVGALSYSIYLWHWPVIILGGWVADDLGVTIPDWGVVALALASVVPAWLSWRFVEAPIHHGSWLRDRPRALLAAGLAMSCVGVLAALPLFALRSPFATSPPQGALPPLSRLGAATLQPGGPFVPVDDPGWVTPDPLVAGRDRPAADVDRCQVDVAVTRPVACTFGDPAGRTTVALVGDSKAMQWLPALEEAAATRGWRVVTYGKSSCAFSDAPAARVAAAFPQCDDWNRAVQAALRADPPDVVVTSGAAASAWTGSGTGPPTPRGGVCLGLDDARGCRGAGRRRRRQPALARRPRRLRRPAPDRADPLLVRHGIRRRRQRSRRAARRRGRGRHGLGGRLRGAPARPHRVDLPGGAVPRGHRARRGAPGR